MKKYIYSISLLMLPLILSAQFRAVNSGLTVKVGDGTYIKHQEGSFTNSNNGSIENNGVILLGADFTQNTGASYTGAATSWLGFDGGISQNIYSDAPVSIAKLSVMNGSQIVLGNELNIGLELDLSANGTVLLGVHNLVMGSGATISNYDSVSYFVTNDIGALSQEVASNNVVFPVGNSSYNPVIINNSGTTDYYRVSVMDSVFDNGTIGIPYTDNRVNRTWVINELAFGGSDLTVTTQWNALDELSSFDRANSGFAYYDDIAWVSPQTYSTAIANSIYWTQTKSNITSSGLFTIEDMEAFLVIDNLSDENNFEVSLFPNPTFDFINIQLGDVMDVKELNVRIYAADGKLVYQRNFGISANELIELEATRDLSAGTYMVQLLLDNGNYMSKKIIKLRN